MAPAALPSTPSHRTSTARVKERGELRFMRAPSGKPLGDAHQGAPRARIAGDFGRGGAHFLADDAQFGTRARRQYPQARTLLRRPRRALHEAFDKPVFERMKADDHKAPARGEHGERRIEASFQGAEFIVDEKPQRLKAARRRMLARLAGAHRARDERGKLARAQQRPLIARGDDGSGDPAREALLSELGNHLANLVDARPSEPARDGLAP